MVRVAAGFGKSTLPAFVRKEPLRFTPAFLRKNYRMAGPLFVVHPLYGIADPDADLLRRKSVFLNADLDRLFGQHRKRNERQ